MPRLPRQSQQNSLVYMGMVSRGNPPDNEPNQSLAAPSNKKLRLNHRAGLITITGLGDHVRPESVIRFHRTG
jgi:hypothetical protein